jgi:hypothetical protein
MCVVKKAENMKVIAARIAAGPPSPRSLQSKYMKRPPQTTCRTIWNSRTRGLNQVSLAKNVRRRFGGWRTAVWISAKKGIPANS